MRDIYEIRRENLMTVLDENFHGSRKGMADRLGFEQPALLSRYLSTRADTAKNIGSTLARKIEQIARRPLNWMDTDHQPAHGQFMVSEPHPSQYIGQRPLDPEFMMTCMDTVRELLIEYKIPKSDPAWTEQSILALAMKLYEDTESSDGRQRGFKKRARDNLEISLVAAEKKHR